jgi:hypothetical protein
MCGALEESRIKKGGEDLMALTSRGGVECCWVNSIDYEDKLEI